MFSNLSDTDITERTLAAALLAARQRLAQQGLAEPLQASVSLRLPGGRGLLFLEGANAIAQRIELAPTCADTTATLLANAQGPALHAAIYRRRADVGAVAVGGGRFGRALADLGGVLPLAFDEQARHLGWMRGPLRTTSGTAGKFDFGVALAAALESGGNAVLVDAIPVSLGMTCQRMVFNAELFEKCATACVLARATGGRVTTLPWWVGRIATGRLKRDQRRAAGRFAQGMLPEEVRGY